MCLTWKLNFLTTYARTDGESGIDKRLGKA